MYVNFPEKRICTYVLCTYFEVSQDNKWGLNVCTVVSQNLLLEITILNVKSYPSLTQHFTFTFRISLLFR